jgi:hypothetical protein
MVNLSPPAEKDFHEYQHTGFNPKIIRREKLYGKTLKSLWYRNKGYMIS